MRALERCEEHGAAAGWRCTVCGALLCPDCTALQAAYPVELPACTRCRNLAEPLRRHRLEQGSFLTRLPLALLYPLKGDGLIAVLASTLFVTLISYLPSLFSIVSLAGLLTALFAVVRTTARGRDDVDLDGFGDLFSGVALPIIRFTVVTLPLWVPIAVYAWLVGPANMSRGVVWTLAALGVVWTPMAFIAAATDSGLLSLLNPLTMLGCAAKVGRDYGVYLGVWLGLALLSIPLALLSLLLLAVPVPLLSRFAATFVMLYAPFVGARVAGLVLYLHGDELGWGTRDQYDEAVLGAVQPRGRLSEAHLAPAESATAKRFAPIELAPEPEPVIEPRHAPLRELDASALTGELPAAQAQGEAPDPGRRELDLASLPSMDSQLVVRIREAVRDGDADVAVDAWRASTQRPVPGLSCSELSWVGRAAAARKDDTAALEALEAAAEMEAAPAEVAKARVLLSRLLEERLARLADARTWMERVVAEQDGTDGAAFARRWLATRAAPT